MHSRFSFLSTIPPRGKTARSRPIGPSRIGSCGYNVKDFWSTGGGFWPWRMIFDIVSRRRHRHFPLTEEKPGMGWDSGSLDSIHCCASLHSQAFPISIPEYKEAQVPTAGLPRGCGPPTRHLLNLGIRVQPGECQQNSSLDLEPVQEQRVAASFRP